MFYWLHDLPTWGMVLLISSVFLAITWLGTLFIRPVLRSQPDRATYVSYLLGSHGVYFGILLGLLALAAFDNFGRTQAQVAEEASHLASLYRDVDAYPEPARSELKGYLQDYTRYVIDKAWPLQRQGVIPREGTRIVSAFQRALTRFEPQTKRRCVHRKGRTESLRWRHHHGHAAADPAQCLGGTVLRGVAVPSPLRRDG